MRSAHRTVPGGSSGEPRLTVPVPAAQPVRDPRGGQVGHDSAVPRVRPVVAPRAGLRRRRGLPFGAPEGGAAARGPRGLALLRVAIPCSQRQKALCSDDVSHLLRKCRRVLERTTSSLRLVFSILKCHHTSIINSSLVIASL